MHLTEPLAAALAAYGLTAVELEVITPVNQRKRGRALHRAHLDDGSSVKLRTFEADDIAHEQLAWRAGAPIGFAPALGAHGPVLVEAWVDGAPLASPLDDGRAAAAGRLLASLHERPLGPAEATVPWVDVARADLGELRAAGCIDDADAEAVEILLARLDPGSFTPCLVHRDFCAVNLVDGDDGRLWVIDNEWFMPGPAAFDVGRTRNRWWMTDAEAAAFAAGYEDVGGALADAAFWALLADLFGARVETKMNPEPGTPILDQLLGRIGRSRR